jgi:hypothetical protein
MCYSPELPEIGSRRAQRQFDSHIPIKGIKGMPYLEAGVTLLTATSTAASTSGALRLRHEQKTLSPVIGERAWVVALAPTL